MPSSSEMRYSDANIMLRQWIGRYLRKEVSLGQFRDWFTPVAWEEIEHDPTFAHVELAIAEYTSGHSSDDELHADLRELVAQDGLDVGSTGRFTATSATSYEATSYGTREVAVPATAAAQGESAVFFVDRAALPPGFFERPQYDVLEKVTA